MAVEVSFSSSCCCSLSCDTRLVFSSNPTRLVPSSRNKFSVRSSSTTTTTLRISRPNGTTSFNGFPGITNPPSSSNPALPAHSRRRTVLTRVIPFDKVEGGDEQRPPDLASYLFANRIVYLGMPLVPAVTELIIAEFLMLQDLDEDKPIYLYINSTGTTKDGRKLGYETEALAIYDGMSMTRAKVFTLCVGNAWGEASLLLAAGVPGKRVALPSASIMMKQPIAGFQGQATDIDLAGKAIKMIKDDLIHLYARHTKKSKEQIKKDIERPKYFSPSDAVEYGLIDKVLYKDRAKIDLGFATEEEEESKGDFI